MTPRETKIEILIACLDLPQLNDAERSMIRVLINQYQAGTEQAFGDQNPELALPYLMLCQKLKLITQCSTDFATA